MHGSHSSKPDRPDPSGPKRSTSSSGEKYLDESDGGKHVERPSPASGLCSTCIHERDCTFPRRAGEPVLFCEEFCGAESSGPCARSRVVSALHTVESRTTCPSEESLSNDKGLCATCEKCATCVFPRAEGGVWHCEEFE